MKMILVSLNNFKWLTKCIYRLLIASIIPGACNYLLYKKLVAKVIHDYMFAAAR